MSGGYFSNLGDAGIIPWSGQSGTGSAPAAQQGKISVPNPSNPNELIWVDAILDANGDLIAADPRYRPRTNNTSSQALLIGCVLVGVFLLT